MEREEEEELPQSTSWEDGPDFSAAVPPGLRSRSSLETRGMAAPTIDIYLPSSRSLSRDAPLLSERNEGLIGFGLEIPDRHSEREEHQLSLQEMKLQLERQHQEQQRQLKMFQDTIERQLRDAQEKQLVSLSMTSPSKSEIEWKTDHAVGLLTRTSRVENQDSRLDKWTLQSNERENDGLSASPSITGSDLSRRCSLTLETELDERRTPLAVGSSLKTAERQTMEDQPSNVVLTRRNLVSTFGHSKDTPEMLERARAVLREHEEFGMMAWRDENGLLAERGQRETHVHRGKSVSPSRPPTPK